METLEPLSFTLSLRGSYIFIIYCLSLQAYPKVSMQRLIFWVIPQSKTNFFWYFWCGRQILVTISPPKTSHVIKPLHTLYSCKFEFTIKFLPYLAWFELRGDFLYALFSKLNKYALLSPLDNFNNIKSIPTSLILKRGVLVIQTFFKSTWSDWAFFSVRPFSIEIIEDCYILDSFIAKDRKELICSKKIRQFQRDPGPG